MDLIHCGIALAELTQGQGFEWQLGNFTLDIPLDGIAFPSKYPGSSLLSLYNVRNVFPDGVRVWKHDIPGCGYHYALVDCGRPWYVHRCPKCGGEIGGQNHVARPNNVEVCLFD